MDAAILRALEEQHFAERYLEKTNHVVPFDEHDMSLLPQEKIDTTRMDDSELLASIDHTRQTIRQLTIDVEHRQNERDAYYEYERQTDLKTFPYLGHLQAKLLQLATNALALKKKELAVLMEAAQTRRPNLRWTRGVSKKAEV